MTGIVGTLITADDFFLNPRVEYVSYEPESI
jgi:hypothetical protein